jgi:hypothetical protein
LLVRDAVPDPVVKPVTGKDVIVLAWDEISEDVGALLLANPKSS